MKRLILGALAVLALVTSGAAVQAQDKYPSKPVKIIVPYAPGGATDIVARILGEQLRQSPRPIVRGREQAGRLRHPGDRGDGARQARRLHADDRQRHHQRHHAGDRARRSSRSITTRTWCRSLRLVDIPEFLIVTTTDFTVEQREGAHRLRQEEPGQGALRHGRAPAAIRITTWRFSPRRPAIST